MENIKVVQFLQDERGQFSSTRLAFLLWTIGLLVVWVFGSLSNPGGTLLEIPNSVIIIISAFMAGKVIQKHAEKGLVTTTEATVQATTPAPAAVQQGSAQGLSRLDTQQAMS